MASSADVANVEALTGWTFNNRKLPLCALKAAHRPDEGEGTEGNRNLAFIGNVLMRFVISLCTIMKSRSRFEAHCNVEALAQNSVLAEIAMRSAVADCVQASPRQKARPLPVLVLANVMKAIVAAVWLDSKFSFRIISNVIARFVSMKAPAPEEPRLQPAAKGAIPAESIDLVPGSSSDTEICPQRELESARVFPDSHTNECEAGVSLSESSVEMLIAASDDFAVNQASMNNEYAESSDTSQSASLGYNALSLAMMPAENGNEAPQAVNYSEERLDVARNSDARRHRFPRTVTFKNIHVRQQAYNVGPSRVARSYTKPSSARVAAARLSITDVDSQRTRKINDFIRKEQQKSAAPFISNPYSDEYLRAGSQRIAELGFGRCETVAKAFYYVTPSFVTIVNLREVLRVYRQSPEYRFSDISDATIVQIYKMIIDIEHESGYKALLRRFFIWKLYERCKDPEPERVESEFIVSTQETLPNAPKQAPGNPNYSLKARITDRMMAELIQALPTMKAEEREKFRRRVRRYATLGSRLSMLVSSLGPGILALLPPTLESTDLDGCLCITDQSILEFTDDQFSRLLSLLSSQTIPFKAFSDAAFVILQEIFSNEASSRHYFNLERASAEEITQQPGGSQGLIQYLYPMTLAEGFLEQTC